MPLADPPALGTVDQQIARASQQLEIVVEQYDAIQVTLARTKAEEARVDALVAPLRGQVQAAQARVDSIAVALYESTPLSAVEAIVGASSTTDALTRLSTLDQLGHTRQVEIDSLHSLVQNYQAQQLTLAQLDATQSGQYAVLQAKRATITAQITRLKALQSTSTATAPPTIHYVPAYAPGPAGKAVQFAYAQIGKPYVFGAAGPNSYDCSGLTMRAWQAAGVSLPHNAAMQYETVAHITYAQLRPGDLIFYYSPIHHVAIYIGGGNIIQASQPGRPVAIAKYNGSPITGYGRPA